MAAFSISNAVAPRPENRCSSMQSFHAILASDNESLIKVIGAIVVFIIWGISSMASAIGKARQNAAKKQQQNRNAMSAAPQRVPSKPAIAPRASAAPPPLPSRTASPLPPLRTLASSAAQTRPAAVKTTTRPKAAASPSVAPPVKPLAAKPQIVTPVIARLLQPKTVRAQFILVEVLQPPLALRSRRSF